MGSFCKFVYMEGDLKMEKFLKTRFGKDIICFFAVVVMFSVSNIDSSLYIAAGAVIPFLPRVIMIWRKLNISERTERTRAAIQFCIFLFLLLWSTDFLELGLPKQAIEILAGAAFYNLILWMALRKSEKENTSEVSIPSTL